MERINTPKDKLPPVRCAGIIVGSEENFRIPSTYKQFLHIYLFAGVKLMTGITLYICKNSPLSKEMRKGFNVRANATCSSG
jgi:hypothetical protein